MMQDTTEQQKVCIRNQPPIKSSVATIPLFRPFQLLHKPIHKLKTSMNTEHVKVKWQLDCKLNFIYYINGNVPSSDELDQAADNSNAICLVTQNSK